MRRRGPGRLARLGLMAGAFLLGLSPRLYDLYWAGVRSHYSAQGSRCELIRGYVREFEREKWRPPGRDEMREWCARRFAEDLAAMETTPGSVAPAFEPIRWSKKTRASTPQNADAGKPDRGE